MSPQKTNKTRHTGYTGIAETTVNKSKAYEPIIETEDSPNKNQELVPYREYIQPEVYNSNLQMTESMHQNTMSRQDLIQDQLQFLIKKGVLEAETTEFEHFKRQNVTRWGTIS